MPRSGGALLRAHSLLLALTTSAVLVLGSASASAAVPVDRYGVTDSYMRTANPVTLQAALGVLHGGGVRVVRSDMAWKTVEPNAPGPDGVHHYDWTAHDQWVTKLALAGMRLYPIIDYSAPWASVNGTWNSRPKDPAQYAAFAAAVVARYGPTGRFWGENPHLPRLPVQSVEIWNEQNAAHFWAEQGTAPRDYGLLYQAARAAVRAVAPGTEVVVGGLVDRGAESFIRNMVAGVPSLAGNVDSVAYHGYLFTPADLLARVQSVRRTMDAAGLSQATIGLTEVGWSELEGDDDTRGQNLAEISRSTADPALKVNRVIAFAAMSNEGDPQQWDQWFGLLDHDATPKTTFLRWAAEIAKLQVAAAAAPVANAVTSTVTEVAGGVENVVTTPKSATTKKLTAAQKKTAAAAKKKAAAAKKKKAAAARRARAARQARAAAKARAASRSRSRSAARAGTSTR